MAHSCWLMASKFGQSLLPSASILSWGLASEEKAYLYEQYPNTLTRKFESFSSVREKKCTEI